MLLLPAAITDLLPAPHALWIGASGITGQGSDLTVHSPIDGQLLAQFPAATAADAEIAISAAASAFQSWKLVPAPVRGELLRRFALLLRRQQQQLAHLVTLECGKILAEAIGEVQEMIDICDFAVGLSRQLHGLTIASERPLHRMQEQWHPLGPIAVISAFNFPVAVWAWNAALALVCGNTLIWKPSEQTPLTAMACQRLLLQAAEGLPEVPPGISTLLAGSADVGEILARDRRIPLVSATGSTAMGRSVAKLVADRLGRSLLELGGNNACIVAPSADLELALRATIFSAFGTCGQRCTSLRRLLVHESLAEQLLPRLKSAAATLPVGNPLQPGILLGPLISSAAQSRMQAAMAEAERCGGRLSGGAAVSRSVPQGGCYVQPAIVEMPYHADIMYQETFAPLLYVLRYRTLEEAINLNNCVSQGLSSCLFTNDLREAEIFLSAAGSDCGIANVNIGPSGAEIGGAFGGEKDTGGGRESGSDAWKNYMRRATNTINYGNTLPLAQGIRFE